MTAIEAQVDEAAGGVRGGDIGHGGNISRNSTTAELDALVYELYGLRQRMGADKRMRGRRLSAYPFPIRCAD